MVLGPSSMAFLVVLVILLISWSNKVSGYGEKELLSFKKSQHTVANYRDGRSCFYRNSRTQNGATILEMKQRDSCTSPKPSPARNHQELLTIDDSRVKSIQSRIKNTLTAQIPINPGLNLQTLNYIITITLGGRTSTVILDTGSDLTWLQCHPCRLCHPQPEPLYDPSKSPTYEPVACSSQPCSSLLSAIGNSGVCPKNGGPTCNYAVTYGDGSYSRGDLAKDDLVLGSNKFPGFVFGCGRENNGLFGSASGLIGLGRSELSLVSQTSQVCLAIASLAYENEVGIIGNYQQRNVRVVYDTKEMKLGFAKETCIFN
ncbi:Eukaryotic aspartyl protease family protein [Striga hermonthica]|uniref:Eukaryotic aspartyl protease family protein n=1 Tax=Striga hermonthica TaxID=68872 RepID=A0A9N7R1U4_STRHE|nr:Eukaryotic aspartyl protease family protein [Striga hermonthica]